MNATTLIKTKVSITGFHYELQRFQNNEYWVAEYYKGVFNSSTDTTFSIKDAKRDFRKLKGELPIIFSVIPE